MLNLYKKLNGEVPFTYNGIGVGTAIAISAGVSAVGGATSKRKQQDAQEEAMAEQQKLNEQAYEQEQEILKKQSLQDAQMNEQATAVYGRDDDEEMGSYDDFITPTTTQTKATGLGGTSNSTGLGY